MPFFYNDKNKFYYNQAGDIITDGNTFSTSTLETDPWADQRLFKYDHTLRTAYTHTEKWRAQAIIDHISTVPELISYHEGMWKLFPGPNKSEEINLFGTLFQKREELQQEKEGEEEELKRELEEMARLWKKIEDKKDRIKEIENHEDAADDLFRRNMKLIKGLMREDQLDQKKEDERRKTKMLAEKAPSGYPLNEAKEDNPNPVRPLTHKEYIRWKLRTCYKCGQLGHGRNHHMIAPSQYGCQTKPWSTWKSKHPSRNRYEALSADVYL